jgi:peptidyl-prolyl cis-trans isomerase D
MMAMYSSFLTPRIVQQLIQRAEIDYAARRMGLRVSDEELRDELRNGPYRQMLFPGGNWIGQEKYEELLRGSQTTVTEFEDGTRREMLARKLFSTLGASVTVTPAEVEKAFVDRNTKVKFQYATLSLDELQKQIKPTDAEIKAFYETYKNRYENSIPEKRTIRYFVINDKDVENKVKVDDASIQKFYAQNQNEFRTPEQVRARHILIKTPAVGADGKVDQKGVDAARAKAQDVLKQVKAGGNFAELAKKYSEDPGSAQNGGELPAFGKGQMVPEFEKVAFGQNPGQVSDLVQTTFGFHIIQTEQKMPAGLKPLAEVKPQIEQELKSQKTSTELNRIGTDAQAAAQKDGLDKAAAQFGAPVVQSNPVARTDSLPGVGAAPQVMNAIFEAPANSKVPQAERGPQQLVVFQVTRIDPPKTPTLDEIKDRVTNEFKSEKANELMRKKVQELADRAHATHDLAKAAKEVGATLKTSELVGRTSQVPEIGSMNGPASVAFTMKQGEISGPLTLGSKAGVLAVTERQEPATSGPEFAKARDQLIEELTQEKREQALQLFIGDLSKRMEKEGKVVINKTEMDNLTKART